MTDPQREDDEVEDLPVPQDSADDVAGGARRTGPGTQTEDELYIG